MHEHARHVVGWLAVMLAIVAFKVIAAAYAIKSTQTCVTNAGGGTAMASACSATLNPRRAWEVQNNGPNAIWCKDFNNVPAVGDGRKIGPGGSWAVDQSNSCPSGVMEPAGRLTCIAETAAQVATACSNLQEGF